MCTVRTVCRIVPFLVLALVASAAEATIISTTRTFEAYQEVGFPKFDPSLGTLNSIGFALESRFMGDLDIVGFGGWVEPGGTYELIGNYEATGNARISPLWWDPPQFGFTFVLPPVLGCTVENTSEEPAFLSCEDLNYGGGTYNDVFAVDPGDHGLFIAGPRPSDFRVAFWTDVEASCTASVGDCFLLASGIIWDGSLTVEYTFNEGPPIPEPTTLALLGLGLAGFGVARRRLH